MRNLDITTLRSFVAVADSGGVTRAAGFLNLTQSAVSMQLKRLEELLGLELLDRTGRTIALTASGEQLLAYARRMVTLNDELITRLTDQAFEGEIVLGVPHDIVYPAIPRVLQQFNAKFPRVKVQLVTANTRNLKDRFERGECDMILTTEPEKMPGAEVLAAIPLVWMGAPGGTAWRKRPVELAQGRSCIFRPIVLSALETAGVEWNVALDSDSDRTIEATVAADLAVMAMLDGTHPPHVEVISHGGALPALPLHFINFYGGEGEGGEVSETLGELLRATFADMTPRARLKAAV
ncbi:LysR family transcriptional regulator [Sedimentitalea todarodis]|uniref:LysR substrate-binding domain-containing protein n=1 Tax=Sedimentitalea todarodis TaxID=1631240 RepID=A0ABU3VJK6_9RHOB|nr:LysR family transcriptional regulator [Sedimentitalea todarodis]MDU9006339.1 LysR substrate-binding domain-containing protein [Sedimentitalea todarodis]